jgi:hypothetical protein
MRLINRDNKPLTLHGSRPARRVAIAQGRLGRLNQKDTLWVERRPARGFGRADKPGRGR